MSANILVNATGRTAGGGGGLGDEEYWPCLTKYFIVRIMFPKSFNRNYFDQIHANNTARRKVSTLEWQMSSLRVSQSNIILNCVLLDFYYYVSLTRPYSYAVRPWQYTSLRNDDNVCMYMLSIQKTLRRRIVNAIGLRTFKNIFFKMRSHGTWQWKLITVNRYLHTRKIMATRIYNKRPMMPTQWL